MTSLALALGALSALQFWLLVRESRGRAEAEGALSGATRELTRLRSQRFEAAQRLRARLRRDPVQLSLPAVGDSSAVPECDHPEGCK